VSVVEVGILGPLSIVKDGAAICVGAAKERALVTALALQPGTVVLIERVVDLLWSDEEQPASAVLTVRSLVSRLRRRLGPEVIRSELGGRGYRLDVLSGAVDAVRFCARLSTAQVARGRGELARAEAELCRALAEWRGEPLVDLADSAAAFGERARLRELRLHAAEEHFDVALALGRHRELVAALEGHVAEEPLRERAWGLLMVALYRSNRQSDALRAYQRARSALVDGLGVEPGADLRALEAAILDHGPQVGPPVELSQASAVKSSAVAPPTIVCALPGNLRPSLTSFVGREEEIRSLAAAVADHRLVTVTGPGGCGKTRLGVQLVQAVAHNFPGGVWLVELAALENGDGLEHAVLAALGAKPVVGASCGELIKDVLAGRPALLLVDNAEHLLDATIGLVEDLLRRAPSLRVVLTSRQPLGVPLERVVPLGPLRPPEQVQLFELRAAAATGHTGRRNEELVVAVCRELDGLPLAIELAAARLRSMTLTELAEGLPHRFRLLTNARSGSARHRSLEALVAWSFDQLTPPQQRFFARLSVFLGDFDLAAAHAVAGNDNTDQVESLALLDALVDRSLVVRSERSERSRYSLLETLRQFGEAHLQGAEHKTRRRHAQYYARLLGELKRRSPTAGAGALVDLIEVELSNVRVAFQWLRATGDAALCLAIVGELATYAQLHPTLEVAEWAEQALALSADRVSLETIRAHVAASTVLTQLAEWAGGERHARAALAHDAQLGDPMRASVLCVLSPAVCFQGRAAEAYAIAREAAALAEQNGRLIVIAATAQIRLQASLYTGARPTMNEFASLRERAERPDAPAVKAYTMLSYGLAALILDEPEAVPVLREAAANADAIGGRQLGCLCRGYIALAEAHGDPRSSLRALRVALVEHRAAKIPFGLRQFAGELLHLFAPFQRWSTIAVLDGAAPPVSVFPDAARLAKQSARRELGDADFDACATRGRRMLHDEFDSYLSGELDLLGIEQHTPTLPG
jgi:predicted ATPase/DNA-binding SARP family transcriptional activator